MTKSVKVFWLTMWLILSAPIWYHKFFKSKHMTEQTTRITKRAFSTSLLQTCIRRKSVPGLGPFPGLILEFATAKTFNHVLEQSRSIVAIVICRIHLIPLKINPHHTSLHTCEIPFLLVTFSNNLFLRGLTIREFPGTRLKPQRITEILLLLPHH